MDLTWDSSRESAVWRGDRASTTAMWARSWTDLADSTKPIVCCWPCISSTNTSITQTTPAKNLREVSFFILILVTLSFFERRIVNSIEQVTLESYDKICPYCQAYIGIVSTGVSTFALLGSQSAFSGACILISFVFYRTRLSIQL